MSGGNDEWQLCALHQKKRRAIDLVPLAGQQGALRCNPKRECFQPGQQAPGATTVGAGGVDPSEWVVCEVHGKKRKKVQMNETQPGLFECKPGHLCRADARLGGAKGYENAGQHNNATGPTAVAAGLAASGPSQMGVGMTAGATGPAIAMSNMRSAGQGTVRPEMLGTSELVGRVDEVWCASHGRRLPRSMCKNVFGLFHVCSDPAKCTASAVESVQTLAAKGCEELICSRHNRSRRLAFLRVDEPTDGTAPKGYRCRSDHACCGSVPEE